MSLLYTNSPHSNNTHHDIVAYPDSFTFVNNYMAIFKYRYSVEKISELARTNGLNISIQKNILGDMTTNDIDQRSYDTPPTSLKLNTDDGVQRVVRGTTL